MDWEIPRKKVSNYYDKAINKVISEMLGMVDWENNPRPVEYIKKLVTSPEFIKWADLLASRFIKRIYKETLQPWRKAAATYNRGPLIHKLLKRELSGPVGDTVNSLVYRNSQLITSIAPDLAENIAQYIQKRTTEGVRAAQIVEEIRTKAPQLTESRAQLIARTEVSKAQTALIEARSMEYDMPAYIWQTSRDSRVRDSHKHMQGVVVFWEDPPDPEVLIGKKSTGGPYHAGNIFNDRCYPEPIISIEDLNFPIKVFKNGKISRIGKREFLQLFKQKVRGGYMNG